MRIVVASMQARVIDLKNVAADLRYAGVEPFNTERLINQIEHNIRQIQAGEKQTPLQQ